jgi:hypothetical protein
MAPDSLPAQGKRVLFHRTPRSSYPRSATPDQIQIYLLYSQHQEKVGEPPEATFKTCQHHRGCSCEPWRQMMKEEEEEEGRRPLRRRNTI